MRRLHVFHLALSLGNVEYLCYNVRHCSTAPLSPVCLVCLDKQAFDIAVASVESQRPSCFEHAHTGMVEAQAGMDWPDANTPSSLGNNNSAEAVSSVTASSPLYRATVVPQTPERLLHSSFFLWSFDILTLWYWCCQRSISTSHRQLIQNMAC